MQFRDYLHRAIKDALLPHRNLPPRECQSPTGKRCSLCHAVNISYEDEVRVRTAALQSFWKAQFAHYPLEPLVPSPLGRYYRTVTKRKAFRARTGVTLGLIDPSRDARSGAFETLLCAIEPREHAGIYDVVRSALAKPYAEPLADRLLYVVVKGSYEKLTVIFSVKEISGEIITTANTLSKTLTRNVASVVSVFLLEGDPEGRYYLEMKGPFKADRMRKLYGAANITVRVCRKRFQFPPLSFTQVNLSLVDQLVSTIRTLLEPSPNAALYDLYCGYGLFGLCLGDRFGRVMGVESQHQSVEAARENAARQRVPNARFHQASITADSIAGIMRHARVDDVVLLDPPRGGTAAGVIEAIAARHPRTAVHLMCNINIAETEISRWLESGYALTRVIPFDMFPGTDEVELVVLLQRVP